MKNAGEVDTLGKELGNCTHRWMTNDGKNKQALSTLSLLRVIEERQTTAKDRQQPLFFHPSVVVCLSSLS